MAVSSSTSFALASVLSVLVFSGMQMNKQWLVSSQPLTLFGGFLGSVLFTLILTVTIFLNNETLQHFAKKHL